MKNRSSTAATWDKAAVRADLESNGRSVSFNGSFILVSVSLHIIFDVYG